MRPRVYVKNLPKGWTARNVGDWVVALGLPPPHHCHQAGAGLDMSSWFVSWNSSDQVCHTPPALSILSVGDAQADRSPSCCCCTHPKAHTSRSNNAKSWSKSSPSSSASARYTKLGEDQQQLGPKQFRKCFTKLGCFTMALAMAGGEIPLCLTMV